MGFDVLGLNLLAEHQEAGIGNHTRDVAEMLRHFK